MACVIFRVSPLRHLKQFYFALMVTFSNSSSCSALPLIISDAKEKFGVSNDIASFTAPFLLAMMVYGVAKPRKE